MKFLEIKGRLKNKSPLHKVCVLIIYNKIISVTGTIGDITNESLLKINYHVNIFKIPRNKVSKKPIYSKPSHIN